MKPSPQPGPADTINFERMLLDRSPVPLTKARDAEPAETGLKLPRDGSEVTDRKCRIVFRPEMGWYFLTFVDQVEGGDNFPRWVLPSETLTSIKPRIDSGDGVFQVSGETTVYRKRLFILLEDVSADDGRQEAVQPAPNAEKPGRTAPGEPTATQASRSGDTPDDILAEMARRRPPKPVSHPEPRDENVQPAKSVAPSTGDQLTQRRGEMIVNRLITVAPEQDGQWMEARFVSDNTLREQPIRLLPCRMLEIAERLDAETKRRVVKFRVSGWITTYEGRQYMLLRKVIEVHRMNRF